MTLKSLSLKSSGRHWAFGGIAKVSLFFVFKKNPRVMTLLLLRSCIMWLLTFQKFSQATRQSFNWVWKAKKTGPSRLTVSRMIIARSWFLNAWRTTARQSVCVFFLNAPQTLLKMFSFFYLADLMEDAHFLLMWNGLFLEQQARVVDIFYLSRTYESESLHMKRWSS